MDRWTKKKAKEQLSQGTAAKKEEKETAVETKSQTGSAGRAVVKGTAYQVLIRPLLTEKGTVLGTYNKYVFMVTSAAKKNQIRQAVKERYGVDPVAVNVVNVQGRRLRFGKSMGRRSDYKKAIVTLPKGQSITLHEGV